jgi:hypothetical protein
MILLYSRGSVTGLRAMELLFLFFFILCLVPQAGDVIVIPNTRSRLFSQGLGVAVDRSPDKTGR